MDQERASRFSSLRASLGPFSSFSQNTDCDDPVEAYFNQRSESFGKMFSEKSSVSGSGSSLGLIDVDNISLFDDEEDERKSFRFSGKADQTLVNSFSLDEIEKKSKTVSVVPEPELELCKQRVLAQKTLKRLSSRSSRDLEKTLKLTPEKESAALHDISSRLMNVKLSDVAERKKNWLEPKVSPYTPRYFNDELSSLGGESETFCNEQTVQAEQNETQVNCKVIKNKRESQYIKKVNSMLKSVPNNIKSSEMEFKTQTKEEQINQLEEDEKKFKLDGNEVLHNSRISEFSGAAGDTCQWPAGNSNTENEVKNLSIGEFFTARSNRISSLVGSMSRGTSMTSVKEEFEKSPRASPGTREAKQLSKNEHSDTITHTPAPEKSKLRRCVSTYDLTGKSEVKKIFRNSSESCSSNSTALVQDILAEMESGLSGTQIYDKLMKSFGRRENALKEHNKHHEEKQKTSESTETPKSSKVPREKTSSKYSKTDFSFQHSQKERKNFASQNSVLLSNNELKENEPVLNKSINIAEPLPKTEKVPKPKTKPGFCASTPKAQALKSREDKIKTDHDKTIINCQDWEPPRIHSIQSTIDLSKSGTSEENDRTITVSSTWSFSEFNKKNSTSAINDTITIEETLVAGDLTVLSQRIEQMKRDSVCIVRTEKSEEPVLLVVIQKLASFPKGTVDCSALTPLIRDQFPELLSSIPTPSKDSSRRSISAVGEDLKDTFLSIPGSWVKLPEALGIKEKLYSCADVHRTILVPVYNLSQNWLLVSLKSIELGPSKGKKLSGVKKNNEHWILDFVVISLVDTIIPPDGSQSLKVVFKSKVSTKLELMLTLNIKELLNGEVQTRTLRIVINNVHPENYINVIPKDPINFGVIADQCFDQRNVQITFDGICDLPLTIYLEEDDHASAHFILKPISGHHQDGEYNGNMFHHVFYEGEKRMLEFGVLFQPNVLLKEDKTTQDFKAQLTIMIGSKTETDGVLKKIPISGSVGFAKFLCNSMFNPLVFKAPQKNIALNRAYPLKNVGELPIAFSVWIANEDGENAEDNVFVAPKTFYLSKNEKSSITVTFNSSATHNCIKRYLFFKIKPNGQVIYNVELIGITSLENKSRTSTATASSKSTANSEPLPPVKLLTTAPSLSWAATALEKESRQTFQIKSLSTVTISIRIGFQVKDDVYKLINENGERVVKMRKVLKPDCPTTLTVAFRPDIVGTHLNNLIFESNHASFKKMVPLNGLGGMPNLFMENVKSDLNGCKILKLQHSNYSDVFENYLNFKNEGRIHGFLLIELGTKDFSLSRELKITPTSLVIAPNASVSLKISQKLKCFELQQLLSGKEISKIATISVVMGDEPSRRRMRQLVESGKIQSSERLEKFITSFKFEPPKVKSFKDSANFESEFWKSLKVFEVAIVIEKTSEDLDRSILEETADEFVTFMSTNENTVISTGKSQKSKETESSSDQLMLTCGNPIDLYESLFPDVSKSKHSKVTEWLETFDCL